MFRLDETPEDPGSPPPSPWGGSPVPSQPGTPSPESRPRLCSELGPVSGGPGDPPPPRGRSRSAPPVLWAAQRYGRRLRRMSDEFQLQVLPRPRSVGGAPPGWGGLARGAEGVVGLPPAPPPRPRPAPLTLAHPPAPPTSTGTPPPKIPPERGRGGGGNKNLDFYRKTEIFLFWVKSWDFRPPRG